jgi:hypothetical protein
MSLIIKNPQGRLFAPESGTNLYSPVDGVPLFSPGLELNKRFDITVNGELYDTHFKIAIPYAPDTDEYPVLIDCVQLYGTLWILKEDGILLSYNLENYRKALTEFKLTDDITTIPTIILNSEYKARNVNTIGLLMREYLYCVIENKMYIIDRNQDVIRHQIEASIIDYWNGLIITDRGIPVFNVRGGRVIYSFIPLLGDWNDHKNNRSDSYKLLVCGEPSTDQRLREFYAHGCRYVIVELVNGQIHMRGITVDNNINEKSLPYVIKNKLISAIHTIHPWVGGAIIDSSAYIYNTQGLLTSIDHNGAASTFSINEDVFKAPNVVKNARKSIR